MSVPFIYDIDLSIVYIYIYVCVCVCVYIYIYIYIFKNSLRYLTEDASHKLENSQKIV